MKGGRLLFFFHLLWKRRRQRRGRVQREGKDKKEAKINDMKRKKKHLVQQEGDGRDGRVQEQDRDLKKSHGGNKEAFYWTCFIVLNTLENQTFYCFVKFFTH